MPAIPIKISNPLPKLDIDASSDSSSGPSSPASSDPAICVAYDVDTPDDPGAQPPIMRQAPYRLVLRDLRFTVMHAGLIPLIFFPITSLQDIRAAGIIYQVFALVVTLVLTVLLAVSFVTGVIPPLLAGLITFLTCYTLLFTQGKQTRVITSDTDLAVGCEKEEWFSVNGICTTAGGAVLAGERLHQLFRRPITCILNRSLGLWYDLMECIMQRDLLLVTPDVRIGYAHIRRAISNPDKVRVVIIAHSQGGILASAWADQLLCDFPKEILKKVEFYTFASAANHFSRPTNEYFGRVEHFANECDFVSRLGVLGVSPPPGRSDLLLLGNTKDVPNSIVQSDKKDGIDSPIATVSFAAEAVLDADGDVETRTTRRVTVDTGYSVLPRETGRFAGRIFMRPDRSGHLLVAHYLSAKANILNDPMVQRYSNLVTYRNGGNPVL